MAQVVLMRRDPCGLQGDRLIAYTNVTLGIFGFCELHFPPLQVENTISNTQGLVRIREKSEIGPE